MGRAIAVGTISPLKGLSYCHTLPRLLFVSRFVLQVAYEDAVIAQEAYVIMLQHAARFTDIKTRTTVYALALAY